MTSGFPKEAKGWHRLKGRAAELLKVAKGRHRLQKRVTEILKVAKEHHKVPKDCRGCPREKPKSKSNKGCTKGNLLPKEVQQVEEKGHWITNSGQEVPQL